MFRIRKKFEKDASMASIIVILIFVGVPFFILFEKLNILFRMVYLIELVLGIAVGSPIVFEYFRKRPSLEIVKAIIFWVFSLNTFFFIGINLYMGLKT